MPNKSKNIIDLTRSINKKSKPKKTIKNLKKNYLRKLKKNY